MNYKFITHCTIDVSELLLHDKIFRRKKLLIDFLVVNFLVAKNGLISVVWAGQDRHFLYYVRDRKELLVLVSLIALKSLHEPKKFLKRTSITFEKTCAFQ